MYTLSEPPLGGHDRNAETPRAPALAVSVGPSLQELAVGVDPLPVAPAAYVDPAGVSAAAFDRARATIEGLASKSTVTWSFAYDSSSTWP
jgi:hypothetical protein